MARFTRATGCPTVCCAPRGRSVPAAWSSSTRDQSGFFRPNGTGRGAHTALNVNTAAFILMVRLEVQWPDQHLSRSLESERVTAPR